MHDGEGITFGLMFGLYFIGLFPFSLFISFVLRFPWQKEMLPWVPHPQRRGRTTSGSIDTVTLLPDAGKDRYLDPSPLLDTLYPEGKGYILY